MTGQPAVQFLLLRHGIAEDRDAGIPDGQRSLTAAGRRRATAVLQRAVAIGLDADRLISSPLRRARQTAEIALATGLSPTLEVATALEPGADPLPWLVRWLAEARKPQDDLESKQELAPLAPAQRPARLALVGHEPDLGELAAVLLGASPGAISLRKAGLALLEWPACEPSQSIGTATEETTTAHPSPSVQPSPDAVRIACGSGQWRLRLLLTPKSLLA